MKCVATSDLNRKEREDYMQDMIQQQIDERAAEIVNSLINAGQYDGMKHKVYFPSDAMDWIGDLDDADQRDFSYYAAACWRNPAAKGTEDMTALISAKIIARVWQKAVLAMAAQVAKDEITAENAEADRP
jgi:hypothetical protein